ncbi:MAG TPA: S8 family serine peptidase [Pyrinomonadaceae bacterium]|nr:S8 family serine peptidase [Pyrinomonadaceae bacterium]
MNRRNYVPHLALAGFLILLAAVAGQLSRWEWNSYDDDDDVVIKREEAAKREAPAAGAPDLLEPDEPEVLVRFRPGTSRERIEQLAAGMNDRVEDEVESVTGLYGVDDQDGRPAAEVAAQYSGLAEVEYAEANEVIRLDPVERGGSISGRFLPSLDGGPNDPLLSEQWGLVNTGQREGAQGADIGALAAWSKSRGSDDVVVAVLDSGVDYRHEDLQANMWRRPDYLDLYVDDELGTIDDYDGFSAVDSDRDPMDENGHGTHCAGIVGAEGDNLLGVVGVNWQVRIMPLKFMGKGGFGTTKDAIEAINYVIQRKRDGVNVRVISASWGSRQRSKALEDVIRRAGEEGVLFVAAAGNDGANADRLPHYPSSYKLPNVLSVAALDRRDRLASFSNYGAKNVHVAAPGKEILSTWPGNAYQEHSGTSMATPFVSGVAALVLSRESNLSVRELRDRLTDTADKLDVLQGKVSSGGRVNAARALGVR